MASVPKNTCAEAKMWPQGFNEILLAGNVKVILERQWSMKHSYMMGWKQ